jgi:hypothetical protein
LFLKKTLPLVYRVQNKIIGLKRIFCIACTWEEGNNYRDKLWLLTLQEH